MSRFICFGVILLVFLVNPFHPAAVNGQTTAIVRANPAGVPMNAGDTLEIAIGVEGVTDLYAFDLSVKYPIHQVEIVDVELGEFLETGGFTIKSVDQVEGVINFAYTQVSPAAPQTGDGTLVVITTKALVDVPELHLMITDVLLSTADGELIPNKIINSGANYPMFLPLVLR